jgi:hypothetical protein
MRGKNMFPLAHKEEGKNCSNFLYFFPRLEIRGKNMFPLAHKEEDFFSVFSYMTRFDLQFLIFI